MGRGESLLYTALSSRLPCRLAQGQLTWRATESVSQSSKRSPLNTTLTVLHLPLLTPQPRAGRYIIAGGCHAVLPLAWTTQAEMQPSCICFSLAAAAESGPSVVELLCRRSEQESFLEAIDAASLVPLLKSG